MDESLSVRRSLMWYDVKRRRVDLRRSELDTNILGSLIINTLSLHLSLLILSLPLSDIAILRRLHSSTVVIPSYCTKLISTISTTYLLHTYQPLQHLIRIINNPIPIPRRTGNSNHLIQPLIPLIATLKRQVQPHPILIRSMLILLPQPLQHTSLPRPRSGSREVNAHAVVCE